MEDKLKDKNITNKESKEETPDTSTKTIMPTMMDEEEMDQREVKRDLSAIIPKFDSSLGSNNGLQSKENELKGDGSVVIGTIENDNYNSIENVELPQSINIGERKAEAQRNKNKKKKVNIEKPKEVNSRVQNITALIAFFSIITLVAGYLVIKNLPKDTDFKALVVTVELGTKLPIRASDYVKPGLGKITDEMAYSIDTSKVKIDEVGDYEFTVTYKGITKKGTIKIVDTTGPQLELKNVAIRKGDSFTPYSFKVDCRDLTGCNLSFAEEGVTEKYTSEGVYTIYIVAEDGYKNQTLKQATLTIEDIVKYYKKTYQYNSSAGYTLSENYELHFTGLGNHEVIREGIKTETYKYQIEEAYKREKDKYYGEIGYTCDDENLTITHIYNLKPAMVGSGYQKLEDVEYYFAEQSFIEY